MALILSVSVLKLLLIYLAIASVEVVELAGITASLASTKEYPVLTCPKLRNEKKKKSTK